VPPAAAAAAAAEPDAVAVPDYFLSSLHSSLQQEDDADVAAAETCTAQISGGAGRPSPAVLAPQLCADQGMEVDDVLTTGPDQVTPTATEATLGGPLWCSTGTGMPPSHGLMDQVQQDATLQPGAGQDSIVWPTMRHPAKRAALPLLPDHTVPPAGDECTLPADFVNSYGIRSTKVLTTRVAPAWWVSELLLTTTGKHQV
jgi:hypothetical protein